MLYILTLTVLTILIAFLMIDRHASGPRAIAEDQAWADLEQRIEVAKERKK